MANESKNDPVWENIVAELCKYLKERELEAHTRRGQTLIIKPRRKKRSRLTGEPR